MHEDESDSEAVAFDGFITTDADHKGKDESSSIAAPQHARVLELAKGMQVSWKHAAHRANNRSCRWSLSPVRFVFLVVHCRMRCRPEQLSCQYNVHLDMAMHFPYSGHGFDPQEELIGHIFDG
jgi:hypothetical protein